MSDKQFDTSMTEAEYLKFENSADTRHEYINGQVYAMAGAGKNHRILAGNLFAKLHTHLLDGPCEPYMGDARVKVVQNYFYPDIVVDCDPDESSNSVYAEKPTLIIEILSESTRRNDKGTKLLQYINTPTVQEYVLVEPEFVSIEVFRRSEQWVLRHYSTGDSIYFGSVDLSLTVEEIYHRVKLKNKDI